MSVLQTTQAIKEPKHFLSQLIHHKHSKTSLSPSNRTAALLTDETQEFALIKVEKNPKQNKTKTFFTKKEIIRVKQIRIFTGSTNIWIALPFCVVYDVISLMLCLAVTKPCTHSCRKQPMCCSAEL